MLYLHTSGTFSQVSLAAAGMCMWVHAMDQYADIFDEVKPRMDTVQVRPRFIRVVHVLRTVQLRGIYYSLTNGWKQWIG